MNFKKRAAAFLTAAMIAVSALPAFPAYASIDMDNLPVPIAEKKNSPAAREFVKTIPELKYEKDRSSNWYYYGSSGYLSWNAVDSALYYIVYEKESGKAFKSIEKTFDTNYYLYSKNVDCEYKIRAVTYTFSDEKIMSKYSNAVKVKADPKSVYNDYDYEEMIAYAYEAEEEEDDEEWVEAGAPVPSSDAANEAVKADGGAAFPYYDITEEYTKSEESGFRKAAISPLSTFSADVDTASYANLRRLINQNQSIPEDAIRIEEMLNYFDYDYKKPAKNESFTVNTELSSCPWNDKAQLLRIGIQAKDIDKAPNSNLVFLVDTSGSMDSSDKLPLVVKSINILAKTMGKDDRISIVTYSGEERVVLAGARGSQVNTVADLCSVLNPYGCTNGESGINAAYEIAEKYFIKGGNNRIILCTDGDLNVGITSEDELKKLIEEKRRSGVYFSVMGFGAGNIKDNKMETLADNGNGSYHYIDSVSEAKKLFVEERTSTLYTIAKDLKIQVEFNPDTVDSYRLIGYDNRRLANEDFKNNAKDAAEIGAGHSVTVLYEIIPNSKGKSGGLKYQESKGDSSEMATIKLRYQDPDSKKYYTKTEVVKKSDYSKNMSDSMKLACAVTEFGLYLKDSDYKGTSDPKKALELAKQIKKPDSYEKEFKNLLIKFIKNYK